MQITMITAGPMLLVAAASWLLIIQSRLHAACKSDDAWQAGFYRSHMPVLLVLQAAVGFASGWILFFRIGINLVNYTWVPAGLYLLSWIFSSFSQMKLVFRALAFATACAVPAFYFSFTLTPWHFITTSPVWYLGVLFYLMARERERERTNDRNTLETVVSTLMLLALLAVSIISGATAPLFERTLCITIAIGAGCLQGFMRLSSYLQPDTRLALGWISMAVPAILGIMLYAPNSW